MKTSEAGNVQATIAKTRASISAIQHRLESLADARVPRDVAVQRVDAFIADLTDWQHGRALIDAFTQQQASPVFLLTGMDIPRQVEHLMAWTNAASLRAALIAGLDEVYAEVSADRAMTADDIAKHRAKAEADLFALEVEEERLIVASEEAGQPLARRIGANPKAILAA
jgi:hypothetical protein